jgi:16S rRNA (guanine966-N2)-methyltransferase
MTKPSQSATKRATQGARAAKATARPAPRAAARKPGQVRIIGGQWKRTKLNVADQPGLRPTPDRVRETLFNWLAHIGGGELTGMRCVDAFAGTGALGFEAASRGAADVLMVEHDAGLVAQLYKLQTQLKATMVKVVRGNGITALKQLAPGSVDIVFIDPPFDAKLFDSALAAAVHAVSVSGYVYLEAPTAWTDELLSPLGLVVYRHLKAGAVHAHLLQRAA